MSCENIDNNSICDPLYDINNIAQNDCSNTEYVYSRNLCWYTVNDTPDTSCNAADDMYTKASNGDTTSDKFQEDMTNSDYASLQLSVKNPIDGDNLHACPPGYELIPGQTEKLTDKYCYDTFFAKDKLFRSVCKKSPFECPPDFVSGCYTLPTVSECFNDNVASKTLSNNGLNRVKLYNSGKIVYRETGSTG